MEPEAIEYVLSLYVSSNSSPTEVDIAEVELIEQDWLTTFSVT